MKIKKINSYCLVLIMAVLNFQSTCVLADELEILTTANQILKELTTGRTASVDGIRYVWKNGEIYELDENNEPSLMRGDVQKISKLVSPLSRIKAGRVKDSCMSISGSISGYIAVFGRILAKHNINVQVQQVWIPSGEVPKSDIKTSGLKCVENIKNTIVGNDVHENQFNIPKEFPVNEEKTEIILVDVIKVD